MSAWPDPEFSRQLACWRSFAAKRKLMIDGYSWSQRDKHLTVDLVPLVRAAKAEPVKPSLRSVSQGRLL